MVNLKHKYLIYEKFRVELYHIGSNFPVTVENSMPRNMGINVEEVC